MVHVVAEVPREARATARRNRSGSAANRLPPTVDVLVVLPPWRSGSGSPRSPNYVVATVFGLILLVPFLDRGPRRRWRERTISMAVTAVLLMGLTAVTVEVWVNNPKGY